MGQSKKDFQRGNKKYMETNKNENRTAQNWGYSKNCSKREVYSNTCLRQQETYQINNLTLNLKEERKNKQNPKPAEGRK